MSRQQGLPVGITVVLVVSFLVGCGGSASAPEQAAAIPKSPPTAIPSVFFTAPADGATVASPVHVSMQAENFTIEPAGERKYRVGHLHLIVDAECIKPSQDIPKDETHLHYGEDQLEADLDLAPGIYTLCLQAGDG